MSNKFKELVIGIQGPRGAGKDSYGSYLACKYMFQGIPCYSNMPIKGHFLEGDAQSQELDLDMLFKFGQGLDNDIVIYISEIDKLVHRRRSISTANMILNVLATQIRKKGITIIATAQDWFWLDDEWVFQTDIMVDAQDWTYTRYGYDDHLPEGYKSLIECYNLSGVVRAPQYKYSGRPYRRFIFNTRAMWDKTINRQGGPIFDSYRIMGVQEMMSKVVLHKDEIHLYAGGSQSNAPDFSDKDMTEYLPKSAAMEYVRNAVDALRAQGVSEIPAENFRKILMDAGFVGDPSMVGKYISRCNAYASRRQVQGRIITEYHLNPMEAVS